MQLRAFEFLYRTLQLGEQRKGKQRTEQEDLKGEGSRRDELVLASMTQSYLLSLETKQVLFWFRFTPKIWEAQQSFLQA